MFLVPLLSSLLVVLSLLCSSASGETGCPPEEDIAPCVCADEQTVSLTCRGLQNDFTINKVIQNSKRYTYQEVHIESSTLLYIPNSIFVDIDIKELYIKNSTLRRLFNYPPEGLNTLYKLHINTTSIQSTLQWELLKSLTNLREISINNMEVKLIRSLSEYLPESVTHLTFYNTYIKKIHPGTLEKLVNLDKFAVESSRLTQLSRDNFPKPFNVRILSFNDNKISKIEEDLFTDMPNLQFLSMENNQISNIPESAFKGRSQNVPYFNFKGNPLTCDCQLKWLIKDKPEILRGSCSAPGLLSGRKLENLHPDEIVC